MKYLLIDGNNMAIRSAFANEGLRNSDDLPTSVHYGVFQSLINLKGRYPEHRMLIAWDGKSRRRMQESKEGVAKGLIPSAYKENRQKDETPQPLKDFYDQAPYLQKAIFQLGIAQVRYPDFEADDVIASYARSLAKEGNEVTIVTSDKDYWQLLDDNTVLWDGMKLQKITKKDWQLEHGLDPIQAIDIGALTGDTGDNIFGIPGWGPKTAEKELKQYGNWTGVYKALHEKYDKLRVKYPDFTSCLYEHPDFPNDPEINTVEQISEKITEIRKILHVKTEKGRSVYPDVDVSFPWAGVLVAFHKKEIKMPKSAIMALVFEDRIALAYSLKKMDDDMEGLPEIPEFEVNLDKVKEYFEYFDIYSLHDGIEIFDPNYEKEIPDNSLTEYDGLPVMEGIC